MKPIYLDDDLAPDATDEELIAADVDIEERRAAAWAAIQRGDLRALQRQLTDTFGQGFQPVPVGTGRIRMEDDAA